MRPYPGKEIKEEESIMSIVLDIQGQKNHRKRFWYNDNKVENFKQPDQCIGRNY